MFFATGLPGWMRLGGSPTPHGYPPSHLKPDSAVEEKALRSQAAALQSELDSIKKRLGEIETEPAPE
jgi:hypothetical protein